MPHRAPLTAARLAEIYDEHPTDFVLELEWEIHRLRATILLANQVLRSIGSRPADVPLVVWEMFVRTIDAEPCLHDSRTPRQRRTLDRLRDAALRRA
ncbi:hypothetical protein [Trinickia dinghuensis]|uniref:hypothetical protein n=1 Tax=Trinickia dinghuensis TaxID=2291023 RepID=UPI0011C049DB|nr:hypothetical protein [Trinickia dinghuensis]